MFNAVDNTFVVVYINVCSVNVIKNGRLLKNDVPVITYHADIQ